MTANKPETAQYAHLWNLGQNRAEICVCVCVCVLRCTNETLARYEVSRYTAQPATVTRRSANVTTYSLYHPTGSSSTGQARSSGERFIIAPLLFHFFLALPSLFLLRSSALSFVPSSVPSTLFLTLHLVSVIFASISLSLSPLLSSPSNHRTLTRAHHFHLSAVYPSIFPLFSFS